LLAHEPLTGFARRLDARVHYAVLKIRTETWLPRRIRVQGTQARASQRHAAASSGPNSVLTQPCVPCARSANSPRREAY